MAVEDDYGMIDGIINNGTKEPTVAELEQQARSCLLYTSEGTEAKILSDVVAQFYAYLSGCMFNDPVGMAIYAELHYMMSSLMLVSYTHLT